MPSVAAEPGNARFDGVEDECGRAEESIGGGMGEERREVCGRCVDGVRDVVVIVGEERELEGPGVSDESYDDHDDGRLRGTQFADWIRSTRDTRTQVREARVRRRQTPLLRSSGWLPAE